MHAVDADEQMCFVRASSKSARAAPDSGDSRASAPTAALESKYFIMTGYSR
jgi:hypothetical protein